MIAIGWLIVALLMLSGSYGLAMLLSIAVIVAHFWEV